MKTLKRTEVGNSAPVSGLTEFAVGGGAGAKGVWLARITAEPGSGVSPVHHHCESEAIVHVISGTLTFLFGDDLTERIDLEAGDFLFIPPYALHAEANLGSIPAEIVMARSTPRPIAEHHRELRVPAQMLYPPSPATDLRTAKS